MLVEKITSPLTFSGISLLSPALIRNYAKLRKIFPLSEVFHDAIKQQQLSAEFFSGQWWDIGTVERLKQLDERLNLKTAVESRKSAQVLDAPRKV
jgi:MurNAc alpha-1-phosphate uridylyltransferase